MKKFDEIHYNMYNTYAMFKKIILLPFFMTSCTHLFYQPSERTFFDPNKFGFKYEEITFLSFDKTKLNAWYFPAENAKGTIIQFHGNAENISSHFLSLAWITKHGYNLFTFDYRGYGKSEGIPSPEGINEDAKAAIKFISQKSNQNVILWGQSLGGIIALRAILDIKKDTKVDAIIIESSFSSYQRIAREKLSLNWFTWPFQTLAYLLVSDEFSPEERLGEISPIPTLVIHGQMDFIVPQNHGEKIFTKLNEPKRLLIIPEGAHINSMSVSNGKYRKKVLKFLD